MPHPEPERRTDAPRSGVLVARLRSKGVGTAIAPLCRSALLLVQEPLDHPADHDGHREVVLLRPVLEA
jgi:hypothetical protein